MSRDKQIEEMAMVICENTAISCYETAEEIAEELTAKGYRKSQDVAEEIFAEIEKLIYSKCFSIRADRDVTGLIIDGEQFAELRKKYIGKDTNVTTKDTEN